jgi:D-glycero-alpha-D-manno-heptose 1-phosphate guanylyltransferase
MTVPASNKSAPLADITAAILAGGLGTRLRSVISDRPKVLAEIHGRPFLTYLLDELAAVGIEHVVLCTGYKAEKVREILGDRYRNMRLNYSEETTPLGTGGALRAALPHLETPTLLVLNGDSFCRADLAAFRTWHDERQAQASLLLAQVPDTARFGRVTVDETGQVLEFAEKGQNFGPGSINAGIYLLAQKLIAEIPTDRAVSLEREVFPAWIGRGLCGYSGGREFLDIGTPESFAQAEQFFAAGKPT